MRIAVVADTHDRLRPGLVDQLSAADEIWHLGDVCEPATLLPLQALDKPLLVVRGNCDAPLLWPLTLKIERAGCQILLVHIPPRTAPPGMDLLLHGHTHVPRRELIGTCLFLNPGCVTRPNRGAPASFAWLELRPAQPPAWELVVLA